MIGIIIDILKYIFKYRNSVKFLFSFQQHSTVLWLYKATSIFRRKSNKSQENTDKEIKNT